MSVSNVKVYNSLNKVIVKHLGTQGERGIQGEPGVGSEQDIIDIVKQTVHGNSADDGIAVSPDGNIRITIGTLQRLP